MIAVTRTLRLCSARSLERTGSAVASIVFSSLRSLCPIALRVDIVELTWLVSRRCVHRRSISRRHREDKCHRRLSSAAASDGTPSVEVTVTSSVVGVDDDDEEPLHPTMRLSKSSDREAEEYMLSLNEEIRVHFRHASYEDALEVATKLLAMATDHFGTLHPATASAYNNVGLMNKSLGRYDEAKEAYHESLRVYGEVCGKDHASYAAALSNLGMLERGRAMEVEASADSTDDDGSVEVVDGDGTDTKPEKMSAMERMRLNDSAIEYFDESYRIRLSELGPDHPHTVSSRSQLGAAMAASVIAERRGMIGGLVEAELRKLKKSRNVRDTNEMEAYVPEAIAKAASGATSSRLTRRRWDAAEEHLRGALDTAVQNPRGEIVGPLMHIPIDSTDSGGSAGNKTGVGLTLPSKRDKEGLSKKDKKKLGKEKIRDKRRANAVILQGGVGSEIDVGNDNYDDGRGIFVAVQGVAAKVTTLSAATAAQNLAVFLKNFSDWTRLSLLDDTGDTTKRWEGLHQTVQEARHLYESALHVRSVILPPHHPDVIATKFSLAELLDSPVVTTTDALATAEPVSLDSGRASQLREEIMNAYNVEEREEVKD